MFLLIVVFQTPFRSMQFHRRGPARIGGPSLSLNKAAAWPPARVLEAVSRRDSL
jgi:hypothetical protein